MASFVIHHIAGEQFLNLLEKKYQIQLTEEQKNMFLLGNLIVDSSKTKFNYDKNLNEEELKNKKKKERKLKQNEKISTHFRDNKDFELCIQAPKPIKFVQKYSNLLEEDLSSLGYLFHLFTDKMFFDDLFNLSFECLDSNGNVTKYLKELTTIRAKKDGNLYDIKDFFGQPNNKYSIYHDYTVMNKILLEYYGTNFNENLYTEFIPHFNNPGIEEVDYSNIKSVISKTKNFIEESYQLTDDQLNVFDTNQVKIFIEEVGFKFYEIFENFISSQLTNKTQNKIK